MYSCALIVLDYSSSRDPFVEGKQSRIFLYEIQCAILRHRCLRLRGKRVNARISAILSNESFLRLITSYSYP